MGSRIRENPEKIFECFLEIVAPSEDNADAWILQKYPSAYNKEEVLKVVSQFAYPCAIERIYGRNFPRHFFSIDSNTVQHFSFVLTNIDSKWTFGYCRHAPLASTCLCVLSYLPWHETFYKLLDRIAEVTRIAEADDLDDFLGSVYGTLVPLPGSPLRVFYNGGNKLFECPCPDHRKLPSFPENRNLNEYYNAIDVNNMILIFASMLNERRVIITSSKLGRLSACVQAASALIYPMHWQHIFIPVLPINLLDYLSAPMPFLIGVSTSVFERAKRSEIGDVVILDADTNTCESPFDDVQNLPLDIASGLKRKLRNTEALRGDGIARAFLHALVQLIGGYRDALTFRDGERISFCRDTFLQTRPNNMQPCLERLLQLQIFQQFIEERLEMLNTGKGFSDIFEEFSLEMDKSNVKFKNQYKEWMGNMKKESGALFRNMKSKANPAVKHAYKNMKDRSRKAYKEVRSMFQEPMIQDVKYPLPRSNGGSARPQSAPSSPTSIVRSASFQGSKLSRSSGHQRTVVSYVRPRGGVTRRTVNGCIDLINKPTRYSQLDVGLAKSESPKPPSSPPPPPPSRIPLPTSPHPPSLDGGSSRDGLEERSPSPDLSVQRINMDLLGDLQDLIFRRCSLEVELPEETSSSSSPPPPPPSLLPLSPSSSIDRTLKPSVGSSVRSTSPALGSTSSLTFYAPPIPPPRSKRSCHGGTFDEIKESPKEVSQPEVSLIRLDSEESDEVVFDPLLDKIDPLSTADVFQPKGSAIVRGQPTSNAVLPPPPLQRFTVAMSSSSAAAATAAAAGSPSLGLSNPVYFHLNPLRSFQTPVLTSPSASVTKIPASSSFPVYHRTPGTEGLFVERQASPANVLNNNNSTNNNNNNNNGEPAGTTNSAVNPPTDRYSVLKALKPQESFLHSKAASGSVSVSERAKLFENLRVFDRAANAVAEQNSNRQQPILGQRKQWQTFD